MDNSLPSSEDRSPTTEPTPQKETAAASAPAISRKARRLRTLLIVGIAAIVVATLTATAFIVHPGFLFMTTPKTVTGNWSISVTLAVGGSSGPGSLVLHQDNSTVKGTLKFQSSTLDLKGTISGQKIDLVNVSAFGGINAHYELIGTVNNDFTQLSGTVMLTGSETLPDGTTQPINSPPGTWSAKRI